MARENVMYFHSGAGGGDVFGLLFSLVILIDLILVGWWLWKQIQK